MKHETKFKSFILIFLLLIGVFIFGINTVGAQNWKIANYDMNYDTPEFRGQSSSTYEYWRPHIHGTESNSFIDGGLAQLRQKYTGTSSSSFINALVTEGHFGWMGSNNVGSHCSNQFFIPDWDCARNTYGLTEPIHLDMQSKLSWSATLLSRNVESPSISGKYNIIISTYWYHTTGNITKTCPSDSSQTATNAWLEAQIRIGKADESGGIWIDRPVGQQSCWSPSVSNDPGNYGWFGYSKITAQFLPSTTQIVTDFDLGSFIIEGLDYWQIPTSHWVLVGYEIGLEGFGNHSIDVNFDYIKSEVDIPQIAQNDINFDHAIDILDLAYIASYYNKCPSNFGQYSWLADTNTETSNCIDILDLSLAANYFGQTY